MTPGLDAVVIGAGPAGLAAATYLGRFRRRAVVLDGGRSRAGWIPESHNTPGFDRGISGDALLRRLRDQAASYGALVRAAPATRLDRADGGFAITVDGEVLTASFAILANGIEDVLPPIAGLDAALRDSRARLCPICDAYEAIDRRIAVLGSGELGTREALFLRHYSSRVVLLLADDADALSTESRERLDGAGIEAIPMAGAALAFVEAGCELRREGSASRRFDHLYLALGCRPASGPALHADLARDEQGMIRVDAHQRTSIEGLYAAGDIVRGLNQIAVATAEGAIAATDIHNRLRGSAP